MKSLHQTIASSWVVRFMTSVRITVVCLALLFILTLWGTIYQIEFGLYPAQERFFNSLYFLIFNFIPFPGARLVMGILFFNFLFVALFRFKYAWPNLGILIIHVGIMLFLLSGFVTLYHAVETHLTLAENEGANVSRAYHDWELAVWKDSTEKHKVVAFDSKNFTAGKVLNFSEFAVDVYVKKYYPHCKAFASTDPAKPSEALNASGIGILEEEKASLDPVKNTPGGIFALADAGKISSEIILFGAEIEPTSVLINGQKYFFMLRPKTYPLPFVVKLIDFRMQLHPGTQMAKSFESTVEVRTPELSRESIISMNNPLRHNEYTFYQSSYAIDPQRGEISTLAVVKNSGRVIPYIASGVTSLGLLYHFLAMIFPKLVKRSRARK